MECFFIFSADRAADRLAEKKPKLRNRESEFKTSTHFPIKSCPCNTSVMLGGTTVMMASTELVEKVLGVTEE
jgi:hypothetical protein